MNKLWGTPDARSEGLTVWPVMRGSDGKLRSSACNFNLCGGDEALHTQHYRSDDVEMGTLCLAGFVDVCVFVYE